MAHRARILDEAQRTTCGARASDYGEPAENMAHIATMWNAYLGDQLASPIRADQVAWMMVNVKQCRAANSSMKLDHYVDAAAYSGIAGECADAE